MLTRSQEAYLRGQAQAQKPIVRIGQRGLTEAVLAELERALYDHELVKIRLAGTDRDTRKAWVDELAHRTGADIVQRIGATASLFRRNTDKPRLTLPR